jgi:hypothetical protein
MNEVPSTPVTVTNIDIPFGRLVTIMLKMMLASIPAILIMYAIMGAVALVFMALFGVGGAFLNNMGR